MMVWSASFFRASFLHPITDTNSMQDHVAHNFFFKWKHCQPLKAFTWMCLLSEEKSIWVTKLGMPLQKPTLDSVGPWLMSYKSTLLSSEPTARYLESGLNLGFENNIQRVVIINLDIKRSDITNCFRRSQWNKLLCFVLFIDYWYKKVSDIRYKI